jgi:hypothetical protein
MRFPPSCSIAGNIGGPPPLSCLGWILGSMRGPGRSCLTVYQPSRRSSQCRHAPGRYGSRSDGGERTSIDGDHRAGHVAGSRREQEGCHASEFLRGACLRSEFNGLSWPAALSSTAREVETPLVRRCGRSGSRRERPPRTSCATAGLDVHDGAGWRAADADQCTVETPEVLQCRLHEHVRRHRIGVVARYADRAINTAQAFGCSSRVRRGQPGYDYMRSLGDPAPSQWRSRALRFRPSADRRGCARLDPCCAPACFARNVFG